MMKNTKKLTTIAIFSAIVIVLQIISTYFNNGGFPITLTLVPVILVGAVYGPSYGGIMGLVFGLIVILMVAVGADPSGATMLAYNPIATVLICIAKGVLAGVMSALLYKFFSRKNEVIAIFVSAATAPIVNTVVFFAGLVLFFEGSFVDMMKYLISINFAIELIINVLLAPGLLRVVKRFK